MNSSRPNNKTHYLNLYFQVHQPRRLHLYRFFDIGTATPYFDEDLDRHIVQRVAQECYLPANQLLLKFIHRYPHLKITFSISGLALDQFEKHAPEVLNSFKLLAETGSVEFLAETYYHSLASLKNKEEFTEQVQLHTNRIEELLGIRPTVFRNTELIYSDNIGKVIAKLGFKGMYMDGVPHILGWRNAHHLYHHPELPQFTLIPRDYQLSDDIAFRFNDKNWKEWPLTSRKYLSWLTQLPLDTEIVTLGLDYETFGEHQKASAGILRFLRGLLLGLAREKKITMVTASDAIQRVPSSGEISAPSPVSWADQDRNLSAWLGNDMQLDAFETLWKLGNTIRRTHDPSLLHTWRCLQTSDHLYYMSTKKGDDGDVHTYFSPYRSPYEAFINYMNVLTDVAHHARAQRAYQRLTQRNKERSEALLNLAKLSWN